MQEKIALPRSKHMFFKLFGIAVFTLKKMAPSAAGLAPFKI